MHLLNCYLFESKHCTQNCFFSQDNVFTENLREPSFSTQAIRWLLGLKNISFVTIKMKNSKNNNDTAGITSNNPQL